MPRDGQQYLAGYCDVLALALHRRLGWPLALVEGIRPDPDYDGEVIAEPCHAVVVAGAGVYADAAGLRTEAELFSVARFLVPPASVRIREVSPDEAAGTFTFEPLDEVALAEAMAWVEAHLDLWPTLTSETKIMPPWELWR